jgi:DNA-binding HxlR family transcriptional regulator
MNPYQSSEDFLKHIREADTQNKKCPLTYSLELISGKWEIKIIFYLLKYDTLRFGELKSRLPGITNTMLTSTLRKLEKADIVNRVQFNEVPPHVEYSLKESGLDLLPIFIELSKWGEVHEDIQSDLDKG